MQVSKNITYQNVNESAIGSFTINNYKSESGKLASWRDSDCSVYPIGLQGSCQLGSTFANNWWLMRSNCVKKNVWWVCPLLPGDAPLSFYIDFDTNLQNQIGSSVCSNGGYSKISCPQVLNVTHFGRIEGTDSLSVGVNARVTGPLISESGGWFLRFRNSVTNAGTPKVLTFSRFQIDPTVNAVIAIPYPLNSVITVQMTASYCSTSKSRLCTITYTKTDSIMSVKNGDGSKFFIDSNGVLYVRIVQQFQNTLGPGNWTVPTVLNFPYYFTKSNLSLVGGGGSNIVITAANCGDGYNLYCDFVDGTVPKALFAASPSTSVTGTLITETTSSSTSETTTTKKSSADSMHFQLFIWWLVIFFFLI